MPPDEANAAADPMFQADPRLVVVSRMPFNAETPLAEQTGDVTPTSLFYVRNHFPVPQIRADAWRLEVGGAVDRPYSLTYDDLRTLRARTLTVTMECAGNGRLGLQPPADGEPWGYGAASTATWTGAPLRSVLDAAGVRAPTVEVVVDGADAGHVAAAGGVVRYTRSLPLEQALHPDTLLVYAMNGAPLPPEHGFPARLIVAGWYGMAAVKWVTRITAATEPFRGFYQVDRYVMAHPERGEGETVPLRAMRVRSVITAPAPDAVIAPGDCRLRGLAWSGSAPVGRVEVSVDGGATWNEAELVSPAERFAWRRWETTWRATPGEWELRSRAFDEAGNSQPEEPEWNRLGYANNAVQAVAVTVKAD